VRGTGLFARRLQGILDTRVATDLILPGLRVVQADDGAARIILDGPDGAPLAGLAWEQHTPGAALPREVVLPLSLGLLLFIPLITVFTMRAERLEHQRAALEQRLDEERELNALKSRFVAMVSHEFRTPLA
jgi:signal transduction histidine kinase